MPNLSEWHLSLIYFGSRIYTYIYIYIHVHIYTLAYIDTFKALLQAHLICHPTLPQPATSLKLIMVQNLVERNI